MQIHSAVFAALFLQRSPAPSVLRITEQTRQPTSILMGGRASPERPERQEPFNRGSRDIRCCCRCNRPGFRNATGQIIIRWSRTYPEHCDFPSPFLPREREPEPCHISATTTRGRPARSWRRPLFSTRKPPASSKPATSLALEAPISTRIRPLGANSLAASAAMRR
jgi:hypothetical protein